MYFTTCATLLTAKLAPQPNQLLAIFNLFMAWFSNGSLPQSDLLYEFLTTIYTFCSIEIDRFAKFMTLLQNLVNA